MEPMVAQAPAVMMPPQQAPAVTYAAPQPMVTQASAMTYAAPQVAPAVQIQERIVEVPKIEVREVEKVVHVPQIQEVIKHVDRVEYQTVEKVVEVPQIEYR